tara:strand:+ start:183 stop:509 length:327 start_codon:yes stop_codon:yes gene_type:complete
MAFKMRSPLALKKQTIQRTSTSKNSNKRVTKRVELEQREDALGRPTGDVKMTKSKKVDRTTRKQAKKDPNRFDNTKEKSRTKNISQKRAERISKRRSKKANIIINKAK